MDAFRSLTEGDFHARFLAVLAEVDYQIGRLLRGLDERGLREETIVVLASDNGPTAWKSYYNQGSDPPGSTAGLRGRKWSLYEGGIRSPLLVRWPGVAPAGAVDAQTLCAAIDYAPTICALAELTFPTTDGQDLSAAWRGKPVVRDAPTFWEYGRDDSYLQPGLEDDRSPNLAVRDGRWKLLANADGSRVELYDMQHDEGERNNLAAAQPVVKERLLKELLAWQDSLPTFDPTPAQKAAAVLSRN